MAVWLIACSLTLLGGGWTRSAADETVGGEVRKGARLEKFGESPGISEVLGLNGRRGVIGVREVQQGDRLLRRTPYYQSDTTLIDIPPFDAGAKYTNLEVTGVSDDGIVIGYATRVLGGSGANPLAFAWESVAARFLPLVPPDGGSGSHAMDISDDGSVIVGYVLGSDPPSMMPCVWHRDSDGRYNVTLLPTRHVYNPFIQTGRIVVSPDGNMVASVAVAQLEPMSQYHTIVWRRMADQPWQPTSVAEVGLRLGGVNNQGVVAGSIEQGQSWRACRCAAGAQLQVIDIPQNHQESWGVGISNDDSILGYSEGPDAPPRGWWWKNGTATPIELDVNYHWLIVTCMNRHGDVGGYYGPEDPTGAYEQTVGFVLRAP